MTRGNFILKFINIVIIVVVLFYYNQMASLAAELSVANKEIEKVVVMQKELEAQRKLESQEKSQTVEESGIKEVEEETAEQVAKYKEGSYEGTGQGYGGEVVVQVAVGSNDITDIEVTSADNEDAAYYNMAIDIIGEIIEVGSTEVDVVSGATYTSNGIIAAVEDALSKAVN